MLQRVREWEPREMGGPLRTRAGPWAEGGLGKACGKSVCHPPPNSRGSAPLGNQCHTYIVWGTWEAALCVPPFLLESIVTLLNTVTWDALEAEGTSREGSGPTWPLLGWPQHEGSSRRCCAVPGQPQRAAFHTHFPPGWAWDAASAPAQEDARSVLRYRAPNPERAKW